MQLLVNILNYSIDDWFDTANLSLFVNQLEKIDAIMVLENSTITELEDDEPAITKTKKREQDEGGSNYSGILSIRVRSDAAC